MKHSFVITRCQLFMIILLVVLLLIAVAVLIGLLQKPCEDIPPESQAVVMTTPLTTSEPFEEGPWSHSFLPHCTVPNHYDLWLYPNFYFDGQTFRGRVDIEINITDSTNYLIVHGKAMDIYNPQVCIKNGETLKIVRTFEYKPNEFWVVEVDRTLKVGMQVILHLDFTGSLTNGFNGFYKSVYTNTITGTVSWLATTKFQPTDARLAFPNFDEPKFKATFTITIKHWTNFTALSNMPPKETKETELGWSETTFEKSVPMSSYLVCFIVCDYVYNEKTLKSGKIHRIWTSPDKINQTTYALDIGTKMLDSMEEEFGINYHLPKLDQIAVPDFTSGALEHWGLITYRQTALLYDEETVAPSGKEMVALIVAHELVHNYFGNLVTCRWWNDIWLNEGFARFFQYKAIKDVHPDWLPEDYFVVRSEQAVMQFDAGASSKPVLVNLVRPEDVKGIFNSITYDKGASLLRMIEYFMRPDRFHLAMKDLLEKYAFSTVDTQDLWNILQEHVDPGLNVSTIMKPWTEQGGLPVVDITINNNVITARQRRFLDNKNADPDLPVSPYSYKWSIPLGYSTPSTTGLIWLNGSAVDFVDPRVQGQWIKFNPNQHGYYRVNYPPATWLHLADLLQSDISVFPPLDRAGLLDDAFNLARASQLNYSIALTLAKFLAKETHYFPWKTSRKALEYISDMLYGHEHYGLWRKFVRNLTDNALQRLKVQGGGKHLDQMMRTDIIRLACINGHPECLRNTSELFFKLVNDGTSSSVPRSIREEVLLSGMRNAAGEREFDTLWEWYSKSNSPQEKLYILKALSATRELWLFKRFLGYCLDPEKIRFQDFNTAVFFASYNQRFNLHLWDWAKTNYNVILNTLKRYSVSRRALSSKLVAIAVGFKTEYHLREVEEFLANHSGASPGSNRRSPTLEKIISNIEWRKNNEDTVISWLLKNVQ